MITRDEILEAIRREANANGGRPIGIRAFESRTSIKPHEWGRYWARFGDAQKDAGFDPNTLKQVIPDEVLLKAVALLTRDLSRRPTSRDIRIKKQHDQSFPSNDAFARFGNSEKITRSLFNFCNANSEFLDILQFLQEPTEDIASDGRAEQINVAELRVGFVYLLKFRRNDYKLGRSNDPERRFGEIATKKNPNRPSKFKQSKQTTHLASKHIGIADFPKNSSIRRASGFSYPLRTCRHFVGGNKFSSSPSTQNHFGFQIKGAKYSMLLNRPHRRKFYANQRHIQPVPSILRRPER